MRQIAPAFTNLPTKAFSIILFLTGNNLLKDGKLFEKVMQYATAGRIAKLFVIWFQCSSSPSITKAYSEPSQRSKWEPFAKIQEAQS